MASGVDRISTLPVKILHHIFSFLPAHRAVHTCVLSTSWRNLWKSMPVLRVIDPHDFENAAEFNYFVNNLLFFRDQEPLNEFEIMTYPFVLSIVPSPLYCSQTSLQYLVMWIQYAFMRKVRVLNVRVKSLLDIRPGWLGNIPLFSQHLTTLELRRVALDGCFMDFSGCPFLEDLKIRYSEIPAQRMSSQSLRRLHVWRCDFSSVDQFRIFAPNFCALELDVNKGRTPLLESNMPLLVTAYIRILDWRCKDHYCRSVYLAYDRDTCAACNDQAFALLGGLSNVTYLELEASQGVYNLKRHLKWCPTFGKLRILTLNGWFIGGLTYNNVHALICFLQHAPVLEKLILKPRDELGNELEVEKNAFQWNNFFHLST